MNTGSTLAGRPRGVILDHTSLYAGSSRVRSVSVAPGALDLLDRLRASGLRTGICSNAPFPPEMMHRQLRANGIAERMDVVVFSSAVGRRKPAAAPYLAALRELRVPAAAVLFVGDRVREDYEAPLALGMRAVLCTGLARTTPPTGVPFIGSLEQLEAIL